MTPRHLAVFTAATLALTVFTGDGASVARAADGNSFALRAGRIVVNPLEAPLRDATLVVRDGRVVAVGSDLALPPDLRLVEFPDAWIVPGFVAAASELAGTHAGDETVAAGYVAADAFDRYGDYSPALAAGVTTAHVGPGTHRLIAGQGAVVKLGGPPERRLLLERSDLCVQLGDSSAPPLQRIPFPASSDVAIEPPRIQSPSSRVSRVDRVLAEIHAEDAGGDPITAYHRRALARFLKSKLPLRLHANRAADIGSALDLLAETRFDGLIVGGLDAMPIADRLADAALVFRPTSRFRDTSGGDLGTGPDVLVTRYAILPALARTLRTLAIAPPAGSIEDLRLAAIAAHGAGLSRELALDAITHAAAEALGLGERIGRVAPGFDADFAVFTDDPLDVRSRVVRVAVGGEFVWEASRPEALVVRAGTIWVAPGRLLRDGEILIENGKIAAIGRNVPRPAFCRVVDAGDDAFVTPGLLDARNHLDLHGDRAGVSPSIDLARIVGASDASHARVARTGITTTILSPYAFPSGGARLAAVKTFGRSRRRRVIRPTAAVAFSVSSRTDPLEAARSIETVLKRGKAYLEKWKKYEKDLAEYEKRVKRGEKVEAKPAEESVVKEEKVDPITGIWEGRVSGGPVDGEMTGKVALRLEGNAVEGRVVEPPVDLEHRIILTLEGRSLTGYVEVDTGGLGQPRVKAELVGEDRIEGTVSVSTIEVQFKATRIEKTEVEFKVTRTRTRDKSGKPSPPKVDENLEPIRALLEKKIPAVIEVGGAKRIEGVLDLVRKEYGVSVVLLGGDGSQVHTERLVNDGIGVVLAQPLVGRRDGREYLLGAELDRAKVPVAFQSGSGDGARDLRYAALRAVERGLSADTALEGFTATAAKLFRIDDRVGTLEPGKDGDLVIFSGHPFRGGARALRVFVNGEEVR